MAVRVGLDLGSSAITICSEKGILGSEPAVVALERKTGRMLAVGEEAERLVGTHTVDAALYYPFAESIVSRDFTAHLVLYFLRKYVQAPLSSISLLLSIYCDFSELDATALAELCMQTGIAELHTVAAPVAVLASRGEQAGRPTMLVHIGGSRTDIMVAAHGRVIYQDSARIAGRAFDEAIVSYLQERYNVSVGLKTAENIKLQIGTVTDKEHRVVRIRARRPDGSLTELQLASREMLDALLQPTAQLVEAICRAVFRIPSADVEDIFGQGILLSGGGASLDGLAELASGLVGVPMAVLQKPEMCVAGGMVHLLPLLTEKFHRGAIALSDLLLQTLFAFHMQK